MTSCSTITTTVQSTGVGPTPAVVSQLASSATTTNTVATTTIGSSFFSAVTPLLNPATWVDNMAHEVAQKEQGSSPSLHAVKAKKYLRPNAQSSIRVHLGTEVSEQEIMMRRLALYACSFKIPEASTNEKQQVQFDVAIGYIKGFFPLSGAFPTNVVWGYAVHDLLKKLSPQDALAWPCIFGGLLLLSYDDFEPENASKPYKAKQRDAQRDFEALFNRCLEQCKDLNITTALTTKWQELCIQLVCHGSILPSPIAVQSRRWNLTEANYPQVLELIAFVDQVVESHVNEGVKPPKWSSFFPQKFRTLTRREQASKILTSMVGALSSIIYSRHTLDFVKSARATRSPAHQGFSASGQPLNPFSRLATPLQLNEDAATAQSLLFQLFQEMYEGIFIPFTHFLSSILEIDYELIAQSVEKRAQQVHADLFPANHFQDREGMPAIRTLSLNFKTKTQFDITRSLLGMYLNMQRSLKNSIDDVSPQCKLAYKTFGVTGNVFWLESGQYLPLLHLFKSDILNLEHSVGKLNNCRKTSLDLFATMLSDIPLSILQEHGEALIEYAEELHLLAAHPLLNVLDFLFGLSALRGDPHFVFTDEATFQPPEEGFLPVSKFLAFTGAKRILKKVMAEKKRALKPPPAAVPASTGASASSSSLLSSTAGAVAAVIPTPIPPPAPKPTAPATNHVDYQQSKKEKKKTRPPPAPAAQPPPLVPSPKPPAPVAPAPADSDDDDDYPAAIKLGALIKILTNKYGLVFLRHRGRQIYAHPADSRKRPIPVPHGSLGKDVKRGAVRAILNNAKEAHTRAKKEK